MQTFLPYPSYKKSAKTIDPSRLGNQAYRECKTLINGGWKYHPASKLWKGYERELCKYALACLCELKRRGKHYPRHIKFFKEKGKSFPITGKPPFIGNKAFHEAMQSNLLRKDKEYYSKFGWSVPDNLPYIWGNK